MRAEANRRRCSLRHGYFWTLIALAAAALLAAGPLPASAADTTKVDKSTKEVETGAKKIGEGKVIEGAGETAKGIGHTVVEGAKLTGEKFKEAGKAAEEPAKTAWDRTKEGATSFGTSVKNFFHRLFSND